MTVKPPSGYLSSATRAGNSILKLLDDEDNFDEVSYLYKLYLKRVAKFVEICNKEVDRSNITNEEKDEIQTYLQAKMAIIETTKSRIVNWLNEISEKNVDDNVSDTNSSCSDSSWKNETDFESKFQVGTQLGQGQLVNESKPHTEAELSLLELEEESIRLKQMQLEIEIKKRKLSSGIYKSSDSETKPLSNHRDDCLSISDKSTKPSIRIEDVLSQQNEITRRMIRNQEMASLPQREPESFDGTDIMKFLPFLQSFRRLIETRVESFEDRLYYLNQYTSGKPNDIVRSCLYMEAKRGYEVAMQQLSERYGNEFCISQAYLQKIESWPSIK